MFVIFFIFEVGLRNSDINYTNRNLICWNFGNRNQMNRLIFLLKYLSRPRLGQKMSHMCVSSIIDKLYYPNILILFVCLFAWMYAWWKESEYSVIRNFASHLGLGLMVTQGGLPCHFGNGTSIPTSLTVSILTPHNNCNLTPLICGTKQFWNLVR